MARSRWSLLSAKSDRLLEVPRAIDPWMSTFTLTLSMRSKSTHERKYLI
jgi:hypothetical protein